MNLLQPECPFCQSRERVKKHGLGNAGLQRYRCNGCRKTFQTRYYYRGNSPLVDEQIARLSKEGWNARKIGAYLKISLATVNKRIARLQEELRHETA
ncbi:IS1 family transposase [Leminorella richardii]|nr:IS1 family transposase [Leminorella richardii]